MVSDNSAMISTDESVMASSHQSLVVSYGITFGRTDLLRKRWTVASGLMKGAVGPHIRRITVIYGDYS